MAKDKKTAKPIGGPFIAAAVLCQGVSEESDGVFSVTRIVDEIRLALSPDAPEDYPSKDKPIEIPLWALVIIRKGDARVGKHKLRLVVEQPNGKVREAFKTDVEMPEYPNGTTTVRAKMLMKLHSSGVFWIDVILGRQRLTRMALNLKIDRPQKDDAE